MFILIFDKDTPEIKSSSENAYRQMHCFAYSIVKSYLTKNILLPN